MQNRIKSRKHISARQYQKFQHKTSAMELVFSKVVACNFGLLHFLKQWGFCSFVHLQQASSSFDKVASCAGFNTNSS